VEGVAEPFVSAGKLVRGDDGKPITVQRYSDNLLLALLKMRRPPRRGSSARFVLPALHSVADAPSALAAIAAAVAAGAVTPSEAADLSRLVETYIKALHSQCALQSDVSSRDYSNDAVSAQERILAEIQQIAGYREPTS
jgi:hypothetical protein